MALPDKDPGMMNGLRHPRLEHKRLEAALEEVLHSESQNIIELVLSLVKEPVPVHPSEEGLSFKDPPRILLIQCQKLPGRIPDPAQSKLDPPQLPLASEPILTHELQLGV